MTAPLINRRKTIYEKKYRRIAKDKNKTDSKITKISIKTRTRGLIVKEKTIKIQKNSKQ